jgi:hypothetical protein
MADEKIEYSELNFGNNYPNLSTLNLFLDIILIYYYRCKLF